MTPVLAVRGLHVTFPGPDGPVPAVRGVDLDLAAGERVGLVGESGSGKSVLARSLLGLLPADADVRGQVFLDGRPLLGSPLLRRARGRRIGLVLQNPLAALNPVRTVGSLLDEVLAAAGHGSRRERAARARGVLGRVGLGDLPRVLRSYPSQLSGGQRQRVLIALAVVNEPAVILADEPTTALDVTVQAQVLATLHQVSEELGAALLLISHDLAVVGAHTDRTLVAYAGRIVESAPTRELFDRPRMPYTRALLAAHPSLTRTDPVVPIPGDPPEPARLPAGCPFAPRCPDVVDDCRQAPEPELLPDGPGRAAACRRLP